MPRYKARIIENSVENINKPKRLLISLDPLHLFFDGGIRVVEPPTEPEIFRKQVHVRFRRSFLGCMLRRTNNSWCHRRESHARCTVG